jgi:hypothetical protein
MVMSQCDVHQCICQITMKFTNYITLQHPLMFKSQSNMNQCIHYYVHQSWHHIEIIFNGYLTLLHSSKLTSHCDNHLWLSRITTFMKVHTELAHPLITLLHCEVHQNSCCSDACHNVTFINGYVIVWRTSKFTLQCMMDVD